MVVMQHAIYTYSTVDLPSHWATKIYTCIPLRNADHTYCELQMPYTKPPCLCYPQPNNQKRW